MSRSSTNNAYLSPGEHRFIRRVSFGANFNVRMVAAASAGQPRLLEFRTLEDFDLGANPMLNHCDTLVVKANTGKAPRVLERFGIVVIQSLGLIRPQLLFVGKTKTADANLKS